jgi:hypothetical protein
VVIFYETINQKDTTKIFDNIGKIIKLLVTEITLFQSVIADTSQKIFKYTTSKP